jgi:hypothetical protein
MNDITSAMALPRYSPGEEIATAVTHGLGILPAITGLAVLSAYAALRGDACARKTAQSRPTPSGAKGRSNVCWSRASTGAADPFRPWGLLSTGRSNSARKQTATEALWPCTAKEGE